MSLMDHARGRGIWCYCLLVNHFTNDVGHKAISSQETWHFKASQPPGDHPFGAYFTTLSPTTRGLAARLRIPREKVAYVFTFSESTALLPLRGGRGEYVFYSPTDYEVPPGLQGSHGETGL